MKNKLLGTGILALLMGSCTVVYQARPEDSYTRNNTSQYDDSYYNQPTQDDLDGYDQDWDADTSASAEPKIDFNSGSYDNGYVYNPAYFGSNFYAGNPFWGLGLYGGFGWGYPGGWGAYSPWGWGMGIGYGWGGYYGWGSIYSGWGGAFGWPGYYGNWGYPWGWGGYYSGWGYSPYVINRAVRNTNIVRRDGKTLVTTAGNRYGSNTSSIRRDMNVSNTRGVRSFEPARTGNTVRRDYSQQGRSYVPERATQPSSRSYAPTRTYTAPERSYSAPAPSYSAPARSSAPVRSSGGGGGGRSSGGGGGRR